VKRVILVITLMVTVGVLMAATNVTDLSENSTFRLLDSVDFEKITKGPYSIVYPSVPVSVYYDQPLVVIFKDGQSFVEIKSDGTIRTRDKEAQKFILNFFSGLKESLRKMESEKK
jgi:hypothetical protein